MPINSQPSAVWGQKNSNIPVTFAGPSGELRTPPLEIKVSYLSICISNIERIELCSSNEVALESVIRLLGTQSSANNSSAADPLNIFRVAKSFGKDMLFIGPLVTTVALIVIRLFFLIKMDRREPVPIPRVYLTCAISVAMFLLCLVSALMQHVSSRDGAKSIQILMHGTVQAELGTTSIALGWVAVGLLALDSSVMLLLLLAIRASTESDMYYTPTISMEATSSQDQPDVTERASDPVVARV
ncbi:hypothetical protein AJ79_06744 [Helicocarpus griseus UAMH5409]|uniref:Transmembrane protein n=1 Tax=Helicocarpus griseus UAMH5409 TaxID=1447875 RepID=A0A2B7XAJ9_9EURO|nr:hypothetical protein AJ79_06744 [Helicocarpus griseus UAMH5409]